jgi:hypothetical protein
MQSWQKPELQSVDLVARYIRVAPLGQIVGYSENAARAIAVMNPLRTGKNLVVCTRS